MSIVQTKRFPYRILIGALIPGLLTGCMHATRLKDRAIVQAVGIDYEDNQFHCTFQYFVPESGGQTSFDASKLNNGIVEGDGVTITEAVEDASRKQGKRIFFGSNKIIVIGDSMSQSGLQKPMDFFGHDHQLHPSVYLLTAENAKDIVTAQISSGIVPASAIELSAKAAEQSRMMEGGTVADASAALGREGGAVVLPHVKLSGEEKEQEVGIDSGILFKDGKYAEEMTLQEISGALWLRGGMSGASMTVDLPDGVCSLEVLSSRTDKRPRLDSDGTLVFQVSIRGDSAIREIQAESSRMDESIIKEVERAQETKVLSLMDQALKKAVSTYQADIFQLEEHVRKYLPTFYQEYRNDPEKYLKNARFEFDLHLNVSRMGADTGN